MAHDIFISYSADDKPTADAACAILESEGLRCWVAPRDIIPGTEWTESILDAIGASRVMVLIFSRHSNTSPHVRREVERAVHFQIVIVPVRIEDVKPTRAMEYLISTPHWMDAMTPPLSQHLHQLATSLHLLLQNSAAPKSQAGSDAVPAPVQNLPRSMSVTRWAGCMIVLVMVLVAVVSWKSNWFRKTAAGNVGAPLIPITPAAPVDAQPSSPTPINELTDDDWANAAAKLTLSMLEVNNLFPSGAQLARKRLGIGRLVNNTSRYIDTDILVKQIRVALFRSGRVVVSTVGGLNVEDPIAKMEQEKRAFSTGDGNPQLLLPDYTLSGKVIETRSQSHNVFRSEFYIQLTLSDISGDSVWEDQAQIVKTNSSDMNR